jgi:glycosyltransferase involved in cell wall biosynthesis
LTMLLNPKKKIFLVYNDYSTFVRRDYELLSKKYEVKRYQHKVQKRFIPYAIEFLKIAFFLVIKIWSFNIVYCWFSDFHSFLPTLLARVTGKKSIIIVGGYDAVSIPEIRYGVFYRNTWRRLLAKLSYKLADYIVAVDSSLIKGVNAYVDCQGIEIGVTHYVKNVEHKCLTVPTGYDCRRWRKLEQVTKNRSVISVGFASSLDQLKLKGFDLFIDVAKNMSMVEFTIIGLQNQAMEYLKKISPGNVKLVGAVPGENLVEYFSATKVFCQFSLSEGLPNALCEAMLCECIPVGTNVGGISSAIGNTGFILKKRNPEMAKRLVESALEANEEHGKMARQRIIEKFGIERRERAILDLVESWDF